MKKFKKIMALIIAMVMVLGMTTLAYATDADVTPSDTTATTGSITIKNATKGYEYNAYKVFDATYDGDKVSYKTPADNASLLDDTLFGWSTSADTDGNISVWALEDASETDIIDWVKNNYSAFGGSAIPGAFDETDSTVTFSDLDFGYYYITSGLGSVVTIDSAVPSTEVYDKNETEPEEPEKTIVSIDGEDVEDLKVADAHVGSVVGFKVTAKTNNWIDKDTIREEWELTDTPSNMTIDANSVAVKVNGTELEDGYTAAIDGGTLTVNITMVDEDGNSIFPANTLDEDNTIYGLIPIEITYSATIDAEAADEPAENEIPGDSVDVFTYAFQVAKTDGTDPLPGAQFELWADDAVLKFIDNGDGTYTYSGEGTVTTLDMTTNTTITVKGLDNTWSYTLKEITVPAGYNQAEDQEFDGEELTKVTADMDTSMNSTALMQQEVVNKQGAELPSTGGIGTTIFYVVGAILVAGAGIILVARRRMSA